MTAGEKARLASAALRVGEIVDQIFSPNGDSPLIKDMKALRDELYAVPDNPDAVPGKPDADLRKLGEQLGSAVSGLVGRNATVNVYVTINGK